ncbi:MAG TPA: hypothetical protein VLI69_02215 [Gammaproteobacteria bacterium]|nr:hypothetical protein [Gammaproteobacteria bacterium]
MRRSPTIIGQALTQDQVKEKIDKLKETAQQAQELTLMRANAIWDRVIAAAKDDVQEEYLKKHKEDHIVILSKYLNDQRKILTEKYQAAISEVKPSEKRDRAILDLEGLVSQQIINANGVRGKIEGSIAKRLKVDNVVAIYKANYQAEEMKLDELCEQARQIVAEGKNKALLELKELEPTYFNEIGELNKLREKYLEMGRKKTEEGEKADFSDIENIESEIKKIDDKTKELDAKFRNIVGLLAIVNAETERANNQLEEMEKTLKTKLSMGDVIDTSNLEAFNVIQTKVTNSIQPAIQIESLQEQFEAEMQAIGTLFNNLNILSPEKKEEFNELYDEQIRPLLELRNRFTGKDWHLRDVFLGPASKTIYENHREECYQAFCDARDLKKMLDNKVMDNFLDKLDQTRDCIHALDRISTPEKTKQRFERLDELTDVLDSTSHDFTEFYKFVNKMGEKAFGFLSLDKKSGLSRAMRRIEEFKHDEPNQPPGRHKSKEDNYNDVYTAITLLNNKLRAVKFNEAGKAIFKDGEKDDITKALAKLESLAVGLSRTSKNAVNVRKLIRSGIKQVRGDLQRAASSQTMIGVPNAEATKAHAGRHGTKKYSPDPIIHREETQTTQYGRFFTSELRSKKVDKEEKVLTIHPPKDPASNPSRGNIKDLKNKR